MRSDGQRATPPTTASRLTATAGLAAANTDREARHAYYEYVDSSLREEVDGGAPARMRLRLDRPRRMAAVSGSPTLALFANVLMDLAATPAGNHVFSGPAE